MEQFISGESKKIFRISSHTLLIGLTESGKCAWQEEEEIREDSSTVLILQEKLFISELFKDIQDATSQYIYHVGRAFILHSLISSGLIPGGQKFEQKTDNILFCLLILWTKVTKILM